MFLKNINALSYNPKFQASLHQRYMSHVASADVKQAGQSGPGTQMGRLFLSQKEMGQRAWHKSMLGVSHGEPSERANVVILRWTLTFDRQWGLAGDESHQRWQNVALRIPGCHLAPPRLIHSKHPGDGDRGATLVREVGGRGRGGRET